jgi:cardiolipin synthase A/B
MRNQWPTGMRGNDSMADFLRDALSYLESLGPIAVALVGLAQVVLATAVTIHVLLRKRDVGAAIGWMGVAWLSPIIGSLLYLIFGINRVRRKAYRIAKRHRAGRSDEAAISSVPRDGHFASLERAAGAITQRATKDGSAIRVLQNGDETYPLMLAAIAGARSSVALSSYIFRADSIGMRFIGALADAKARGVDVRVIIDGIGGGYLRSPAYARLRRRGVPVVRFLHSLIPWRMAFLNLRNHKKLLILDGARAFIGGLNISDDNLLAKHPLRPVKDVHFYVQGPIVAQLTEAFATDWLFVTEDNLRGTEWFPPLNAVGSAVTRVVTSGPDQDIDKVEYILLQAIGCAQHSVKIATPYFLPSEQLLTALVIAAMRGVQVDVVMPKRSDHVLLDWAMRAHIRPLLASGGRIWTTRESFEHAKLSAIDDGWALIGSSNWDIRSLRLNFELNMEVYDGDFARLIGEKITKMRADSMTLTMLDRRTLPARLRDSMARLLLPYL